jgi:cell division transport system permease protein
MSLASVSTVALALFVLAFFSVLSLNLSQAAGAIDRQVEVRVFFKPTATHAQEHKFLVRVRHWPGVRRIDYFTKGQALNQLRSEFPNDQALFHLIEQGNPLYDGFDLFAHHPGQIPGLARRLRATPIIQEALDQSVVVNRLQALTHVMTDAGYVIEAMLALATLFIISNTIRLGVFARRREIQVMKLVGATDWLIRWPFLLEGVVLGLVGAALASVGVVLGYHWVVTAAARSLAFFPLAPLTLVERSTVLPTVVGGVAMGLVGSLWSLRRFLRV